MTFMRAMRFCTAAIVVGAIAGLAAAADAVKVWNYAVLGDAYRVTSPGPVAPITIVGARNGTFSGCVAVDSAKPITGLKASMGKLSQGEAVIPAAGVAVRYAVSWPDPGSPVGLDILLEAPPAEVAVNKTRALAGVWVTVNVPADAKAGAYRGELTVEAAGGSAQKIPVELTVVDWRMPDPQDWRTWIEMIQSPDTLSIEYNVPLWSEKHWAMIAKSFQLMRPTSSRTVYVPLLRCTNQGNAESMVRWIKQKDGSYKQDYSVMDKYLDLAQKNLGDLKLVVFTVWDSYLTRSYRNESYEKKPTATTGPEFDRWQKLQRGLTVTMLDEATGKTEPGFLPHYTDANSKALWKPVYDELHKRMKARGLEKAMVLGIVCDMEPSKEEVKFLQEVSGGLSWICHAHEYRLGGKLTKPNKQLQGIADICYEAQARALIFQVNPEKGHLYGWKRDTLSTFIDRFFELNGEPLRIRQITELNITGNQRGVGRLGGDFWNVFKNKNGQRAFQVFERYPENWWRGLNIANYFLAPGPVGPVATSRLENLREGTQECEARIFLESSLLDANLKERMGADLAQRAQKVLDEHQFAIWQSVWTNPDALKQMGTLSAGRDTYEAIWDTSSKIGLKLPEFWSGEARKMRADEDRKGFDWFMTSGWQQRNKQLFDVAAEAQQKLK